LDVYLERKGWSAEDIAAATSGIVTEEQGEA